MANYISNLNWLVLSLILNLDLEETKLVLRGTYETIKKHGYTDADYSKEVLKALDFYISNIDHIEI